MDAGADIFHGHSAHIFQRVQLYRGKPILFDTGDLLDDYAIDERLRNDLQLLFLVEGTGGGGWRVEMVPLLIGDMQVNLARGGRLSRDLSTYASALRALRDSHRTQWRSVDCWRASGIEVAAQSGQTSPGRSRFAECAAEAPRRAEADSEAPCVAQIATPGQDHRRKGRLLTLARTAEDDQGAAGDDPRRAHDEGDVGDGLQ
jgi:hypothetical protein